MGSTRRTAPFDQEARPINVRDGTNTLSESSIPGPTRGPCDVSFEIGASFDEVETSLTGLDAAELQVLGWLRENKQNIVDAEGTFRIDRRAIAGAIAWEMLENVRPLTSWHLSTVGPGKVHLFNL